MTSKYILETLDKLVPNPKCPLNYTKDYELLLAVMLSAQTTDERVNSVTKNLFKYDIRELASMGTTQIEEIIKPVGTQKRKSEYIKKICTKLLEDQNGKIPHDREYIESLPGVGHKTCNVLFTELFDEPALAVDTHVSRTSKILGLTLETDDVLTVEKKLMEFFPKSKWARVHVQLVLFGRHTCKAKNPECSKCPFYKKCLKTKNDK